MEQIKVAITICLNHPQSLSGKITNGILALIMVLSIIIIPMHFIPELKHAHPYLAFVEKITVTIFTIEYALRIWINHRKARYIFSWWGLIDLIAILPFYLAKFGLLERPEIFLLMRILRMLKLAKLCESDQIIRTNMTKKGHGDFVLMHNEKLEDIAQKHMVLFILGLSMPLICCSLGLTAIILGISNIYIVAVGILFILLGIGFFIKIWLDYLYDILYITNQRIVIQDRKLFGTISYDIAYDNITNTVPDTRGFFRWILNFGDIEIQTASGVSQFFRIVANPYEIANRISHHRQEFTSLRLDRQALRHKSNKIDSKDKPSSSPSSGQDAANS